VQRYEIYKSGKNSISDIDASGLEENLPALGRYLTEHTFCQTKIVLYKDIMDNLHKYIDEDAKNRVDKYQKNHPEDPIKIPINELQPQLGIFCSEKYPWHCQIHRDIKGFGNSGPSVDERLIVDLRWFGVIRPRRENRVFFVKDRKTGEYLKDRYDMPQPTFEFSLSEDDSKLAGSMMNHMLQVASKLGTFLPGSEPYWSDLGAATHMGGTFRMGKDFQTSVVDQNSQV